MKCIALTGYRCLFFQDILTLNAINNWPTCSLFSLFLFFSGKHNKQHFHILDLFHSLPEEVTSFFKEKKNKKRKITVKGIFTYFILKIS